MKKLIKKILSLVLTCSCIFCITACGTGNETSGSPVSCAHSYVSVTTKQETCKEAGVRTYTCGICGDSYTEEIPPTGKHSGVFQCTECATIYYNVIRKHIHQNASSDDPATDVKYIKFNGDFCPVSIYADVYLAVELTLSGPDILKLLFHPMDTSWRIFADATFVNISPADITADWKGVWVGEKGPSTVAIRVKALLNMLNDYFEENSFGFDVKNLGFVNYEG